MREKIGRVLKNGRGDTNYISTVVFLFTAAFLAAFILDIFGIISAKQELDLCADQMVKQIQLSGGINRDTDRLFEKMSSEIGALENIRYEVEADYSAPRPGMRHTIQLGNSFYLTLTGEARLGGVWKIVPVPVKIVSGGAGVSEHYWK